MRQEVERLKKMKEEEVVQVLAQSRTDFKRDLSTKRLAPLLFAPTRLSPHPQPPSPSP